MKKNKIVIDGKNNTVLSDVKRSKIQIGEQPKNVDGKFWIIMPAIVALIGLVIALIVDWDKIIAFFK